MTAAATVAPVVALDRIDAIAALATPGAGVRTASPGLDCGAARVATPAVASYAVAGVEAPGAGQELFGKVILTPLRFNMSLITNDKTQAVTCWNTSVEREQALRSVLASDDSVYLPSSVSRVQPGVAATVPFTVSGIGSARLDCEVQLVFDKPVKFYVTGVRLLVFSIEPDWESGFSDSYEQTSSVLTSRGGYEQRASLRSKPVRRVSFDPSAMESAEAAAVDALLQVGQARVYAVPVWPEAKRISGAEKGAFQITADTADTGLVAGGYALLYRSYTEYEAVELSTVSAGQVTTTYPLQRAWPAGTLLLPALPARLEASINRTRTSQTTAGTLTFTAE